jgi:hypothetical protein
MTTPSAASKSAARAWQARGASSWLSLAASPTFALMARMAANHAPPIAICSQSILPIDGMTTMYVLMSLFHLSPWLKLASSPIGCAPNR